MSHRQGWWLALCVAGVAAVGGCNCNTANPGDEDAGSSGGTSSSSSGASASGGTSGASGSASGGASGGTSSGASGGASGGASSGASGGADAGPGFSVTGLFPTAAYRGEDTLVSVLGTGFAATATVTFTHRTDPGQTGGTFTLSGSVNASATAITVLLTMDLARPAGLYTVSVAQGLDSGTAPDAFRVTVAPPPTVTDVTPRFAFAGNPADSQLSDRALTLQGTGFLAGAAVEFIAADSPARLVFDATDVHVDSATTVTATIPSESQVMPVGHYFVTLTNPDGQSAYWLMQTTNDGGVVIHRGLVEVRNVPPPVISSIQPSRPNSGNASPLTVNGQGFATGATVALVAPDGTVCPAQSVSVPGGQEGVTLVASLDPAAAEPCALSVGDFFLVRVTNPDGQYADYASLHIYSNAEGKLGSFTGSATAQEPAYGRTRHDSTLYFDDVCGPSLVMIGGEGRLAGGSGTIAPLHEAERATVTPFGELGGFGVLLTANNSGERITNLTVSPRVGAQVQSLGNWVFMLGGMDAAGAATATTERATILTRASAVGAASVVPGGTGSLPAGRFHYAVAAVLPDGERFAGEGLPSRAVAGRTDVGGALSVVFEEYPGAAAYRVYRSVAPGAGAGFTRLIAHGTAAAITTAEGRPGLLKFSDLGTGEMGASPGDVSAVAATGGTLPAGFYGYRVAAVHQVSGSPWEAPAGPTAVAQATTGSPSVALSWSAVPGATAYRVYRTPATGLTGTAADAARATLRLGEFTTLSLTDDGSVALGTLGPLEGEAPLARGSLSRFELDPSSDLRTARQGHALARVPLGSAFNQIHLYVAGGRAGRTGTTLATMEHATLDANGHLAWTVVESGGNPLLMTRPRAYFPLTSNATAREAFSCASNPRPPDPCENPDRDGDGFRRVACGGTDCDDTRPDVNVNASEICTDAVDNDCDTLIDGADPDCELPDAGQPLDAGTPDAAVPADAGTPDAAVPVDAGVVVPDAGPCANTAYADADNDGFRKTQCGGTDCNDGNPLINPGIYESPFAGDGLCGNGVDEDCTGGDQACFGGALPPGPWAMVGPEEVYLVAAAGSEGLTGSTEQVVPAGANPSYSEMAFVRTDGTVGDWLNVDAPSQGFSGAGYGLVALNYYNFLYVVGGGVGGGQHVDRTSLCLPTSASISGYADHCQGTPNAAAWVSGDLMQAQSSTAGGLTVDRYFPAIERIFSTVFVLGGNDGPTGAPTHSYDRTPE